MKTRRGALTYLTGGAVAVGALAAGGGLMRSCAPDAATVAAQNARLIDLPTERLAVVIYERHPILFKRLNAPEKSILEAEPMGYNRFLHRSADRSVRIPATADAILQDENKDLLVLSLVCPREGCILNQDSGDWRDQGGFFCPCGGAHYDGLGRVRKASSPSNMLSPEVRFQPDGRISLAPYPERMRR